VLTPDSRWRGTYTIRVGWLLLVSPLVCIFMGSLAGGCATLLIGAAWQSVSVREAVSAIPDAVMYSLIIAGPVGLVGGAFGALLAGALGRGVLRQASRSRWIRVGAVTGAVAGLLLGLFFLMSAAGTAPPSVVLPLGGLVVLVSASAGGVVGFLGWREFGDGVADDSVEMRGSGPTKS
jgi:hypothetical protein